MDVRQLAEDEIPALLREIPQPPTRLFLAGALPKDTIYLTVVGSRAYTSYGKEAAEYIIHGLSGWPFTIVSGLAHGIDRHAHRSAIEAGLTTVAIPGSGLHPRVLYPRSHTKLAGDILRAGGALLSEYDPETPARKHMFPERNRLMAGVSRGVLIIEAREKSGSLITARLATEYNRDVFAVPGPIFASGSRGTNALIHAGAAPITSARDILFSYGFNPEEENGAARESTYAELSELEMRVMALLEEDRLKDELARMLRVSAQTLNATLTGLALKGLIRENGPLVKKIHL